MLSRRIVTAGILGAIAFALLFDALALAVDDGIPRTRIQVAGENRAGSAWVTTDTRPTGPDECVTGHGDGIPFVREHLEVPAGRQPIELLFMRNDRPRKIGVTIYRRLDDHDIPTGPWNTRHPEPEALTRSGRVVGWRVEFRVALAGNRYIESHASWKDQDSCGGTDSAGYVYPGLRPE